jgi:hypothetical protein
MLEVALESDYLDPVLHEKISMMQYIIYSETNKDLFKLSQEEYDMNCDLILDKLPR